MAQKSVTLDKKSQAVLNRLAKQDPERIFAELTRFFEQQSQIIAGRIVKNQLSGQLIKRRTGTLARSVIGQAEKYNGLPAFRVGVLRGPALSYASILERGGTIRPKNAKSLAIPQKPALTPAGVEKFGGPRSYPGELRFLPFRRGVAVGKLVDEAEAIAFESQGLSPYQAEAVYLLVRSVTIKPRYWLKTGMKEQLPPFIKRMAQFLAGAIANAPSS